MTGIDTTFLIDLYWSKSPRNKSAVEFFRQLIKGNEQVCIYYYVFNEFMNVITDPKRFETPLSMSDAVSIIDQWRDTENVNIIYPDETSLVRTISWINLYKLGRKRLNDTFMAAAYASAGVSRLVTANPSDFRPLNIFELINYGEI